MRSLSPVRVADGLASHGRIRSETVFGSSLGGSRALPLTGARSSDQLAEQLGSPPSHHVPRSSRSRQAPTRARNARIENTVRTPFQKSHGPSYAALARASSPGDAPAEMRASSSFIGTFTKTVSKKPPPM